MSKSMANCLGSQGCFPIVVGMTLTFLLLSNLHLEFVLQRQVSFVRVSGTHFIVDSKPFYVNGWNSYWLMAQGADYSSRSAIRTILRNGAQMRLSVCRTWAFYDGKDGLQTQPGQFSEDVFKALDYVIVEARRQGVYLLLSLVNSLPEYGGKGQYVEWARSEGYDIGSSNDSFFRDPTIRGYFKDYMKKIMTRVNSFSGVAYRDEPTIFAWELINEPRCPSDPSGDSLQDWIEEMAAYAKSIDNNHLLTVGLEGFYGKSTPEKLEKNPGEWATYLGTDFIRHSKIDLLDFASVHVYPETWIPHLTIDDKVKYVQSWVNSHIDDAETVLHKPVLFTEFGVSDQDETFSAENRFAMMGAIYNKVYESAKRRGSGAGVLVWQFLVEGLDKFRDEFTVMPWQEPMLYNAIVEQSCRLYNVSGFYNPIQLTCSIKGDL